MSRNDAPQGRSFKSQCALHHICVGWLQYKWRRSFHRLGSQSDYDQQHPPGSMSKRQISVISHGDLEMVCYYRIARPVLTNTQLGSEEWVPVVRAGVARDGFPGGRKEHIQRLSAAETRFHLRNYWTQTTREWQEAGNPYHGGSCKIMSATLQMKRMRPKKFGPNPGWPVSKANSLNMTKFLCPPGSRNGHHWPTVPDPPISVVLAW